MPHSIPAALRPVAAALAAALLTVAATAQAETDPIVMFDGFDECAPVQAEIGPAGGVLRMCGAVLTVPEFAVAEPTLFGIEPLGTPPDAPFDMELAGTAYRFMPDDRYFDQALSVRVPREDARRGGLAMQDPADDAMFLMEACQSSLGGVQQHVNLLGTFAAVRYAGDVPQSTQGLGDGTLTATVNGVTHIHDLDTPGANWAIYNDQPDGSRLVTVSALKDTEDGGIERVRLDFVVDMATGSGSLAQISAIGAAGGSYIADLMGSAQITFGDLSDGRIRAQIVASLASGPDMVDFAADFDIGVERYYFPPSMSCPGGGEMPPG